MSIFKITSRYIQWWLVRSVWSPILNKLMPTYKSKVIVLVLFYLGNALLAGWYFYGR